MREKVGHMLTTVCVWGRYSRGHAGKPASVFITLHRLRVMRPMMLISVMVSAPYSSLSAAKRFSLESPEDTHRVRQTANYRGGEEPAEALHSATAHCALVPRHTQRPHVCTCVYMHKHSFSCIRLNHFLQTKTLKIKAYFKSLHLSSLTQTVRSQYQQQSFYQILHMYNMQLCVYGSTLMCLCG